MAKNNQEPPAEPKVGVYICHCGGNISDHVDVKKVAEAVRDLPGVKVSHTNMFMCSDPGQELIQKDIREGVVNRVVVASCAPSLHETTFRGAIKRAGMNPYLYDHANIREQDSWVHHGDAATAKARALIAAAVAKARNLAALDPIRVNARNHVTVIGAGVAGLRAALDLARRGMAVALVEQSPFLGGQAAALGKVFPTGEAAADLIRQLAEAVVRDPNIQLHTCSRVTAADGYVGNFKITLERRPPESAAARELLKQAPAAAGEAGTYLPLAGFFAGNVPADAATVTLETGAIVFATGFAAYTPRSGEFGYGAHPEVITLKQLLEILAREPARGDTLMVGGRPVRRLAMIHCVGSRQIPGLHEPDESGRLNEYCSRTCCSAILQAASEIRDAYPATRVLDYFRDIRTYGRGQEELYERAAANGVLFFRYEADAPPRVEGVTGGGFPLKVTVADSLTFGEELEAEVDLVVLATAMVPSRIDDLVEMLKLPVGADGFLQEVHPKLRPVELANTGVLLAGTCQAPMDITEACNAAQAAAAKASSLLGRGYVELDPFVARVDRDRCAGHGACVAACPVQALALEETAGEAGTAARAGVNPALCTGCGICVAVCPENAIDVMGWSLRQYEDMVDAIVAA